MSEEAVPETPDTGVDLRVVVAAESEVTAPLVSEAMELPPEVDMAPEPEVRSDCSVVYLEDPPEMPEVT